MKILKMVQFNVDKEIKEFKSFYKDLMKTDNKLQNIILQYILKHNGKQMRPLLVMLTAKLNGEINEKTFVAAALIELLHTATLVHDDVVDNSQLRRNTFSIKALWKSKLAVLVGDYLLSKGLLLSVEYSAYDVLEIVSKAVQEMSEGELLQIENSRKINLSVDEYYKVITKKTASLIIAASKSAVISVSNDKNQLGIIEEVGRKIGIAFQIKDDLFDYESTLKIGKPKGNDIQESKMTLPLIYALNNVERSKRKKIIKVLRNSKKSREDVLMIQKFVKSNGGIKFATEQMEIFSNEAKQLITTHYSDSEIRTNYISFIDYVIKRNV